jgi:LPXTG-motif cell wall-anchored protein
VDGLFHVQEMARAGDGVDGTAGGGEAPRVALVDVGRERAAHAVEGVWARRFHRRPQVLVTDAPVQRRERGAVDAPAHEVAVAREVQQQPVGDVAGEAGVATLLAGLAAILGLAGFIVYRRRRAQTLEVS